MKKSSFEIFPTLQTKNLLLTKITNEYWEDLIEIATFSKFESSKEGVNKLIQKIESNYNDGNSINWGIFLNQKLIGTCGYYRGFNNNTGEIGFVMRENYRNQGYMREAIEAITEFGFDKLELSLVTAFTKEGNNGAIGLLQSLGFKKSDSIEGEYLIFKKRIITNKQSTISKNN